jgi:DNA-directed RNA polymerase specialized sigma24 family protein
MLSPAVVERVRAMLRGELGVSLSDGDGSTANQDALELLQEILMDAAGDSETPVENPEAWTVTIAEHRIADYLRRFRPRHSSIRARLRYFLRHLPGYAEWMGPDGRMAGFAGWAGGRRAAVDAVDTTLLEREPTRLPLRAPVNADLDRMGRDDWDRLLDAIFLHLGGPVRLKYLASIVCNVLRVEEVRVETLEPGIDLPDQRMSQPDLESRETLRAVWGEIVQLLPRQRVALLLNLGADGDPGLFAEAGVAELDEICRALGLTAEQFEIALRELAADTDPVCTELLKRAPLADLVIAKMLGATRDQVIGLRRKARERLARRIGNIGGHSTPSTSTTA